MRYFAVSSFYHVFTKSIAGYKVFNSNKSYERITAAMEYYSYKNIPVKFSSYILKKEKTRKKFDEISKNSDKLIDIIAYCIMPTHIHLLLTPLKENGISVYMKNLLNSYSRYFNTRNNRKGPLWQGRFKDVIVENDEQLLHLTRYIHLNPTTSGIVDKPEDWKYSSYGEYLRKSDKYICNFKDYIDMNPESYRKFTESRLEYQKELSKIKHLIIE
jgi:putative transposase